MAEINKVSLEDVAKYCGLSTVTVSRVLNHSPSVREYNRKKVEEAISALKYIPNPAARTLASGRTGIIGMITQKLQDPFFSHTVQAVNNSLIRHNMFLAISVTVNQGCDYILQQQRLDGMMVLAPEMEDQFVSVLKQRHVPFVVLDSQNRQADYSCILVDNFDGGYQVGCHFLELGHKKISYIGGPLRLTNSMERESGLKAALKEQGLTCFAVKHGEFCFTDGYRIMETWIKEDKVPTAVFAADCNLALGAMTALKEYGYRIPQDVSVCGFDDAPMAEEYVPALTIVAQPAMELAECATEQLFSWIAGEKPQELIHRLKPVLIVRESTGYASL